MKKIVWLAAALALAACSGDPGTNAADYPEWEYTKIKRELAKGWNTWDSRSVFTQVWSEDQIGVKVSIIDLQGNENDRIRIGNRENDAAIVHPYDHTYDGTYSEVDASWHGVSVKMRCAADGKRLVMLFTPTEEGRGGKLKVSPRRLWAPLRDSGSCEVREDGFELKAALGAGGMTGKVVSGDTRFVRSASESYYLCPADAPVLVYTGEDITVAEAEALMQARKKAFEDSERSKWGDGYDAHHAMQSVLAWDTVYDPVDAVIVTPVSRNWNQEWSRMTFDQIGGYVLFDWDTYFASEMLSVDNREIAYCNAIEITKAADKCGFVPNYTCSNDRVSYDRSQPPVGSRAVWTIYERYGDRWFLEMLYPRLLRWNLWWVENREAEGLLCWGSSPRNGEHYTNEPFARQQAVYESGLDNTCVYDDAEFLLDKNITCYNDVGLNALYVMDCEYLAKIATELGKKRDAREILDRGKRIKTGLQELWSEEDGMFYCKDLRTGKLVRRMDPTNFYPMLVGTATPAQADAMIKRHLLNEDEFWGEWVIPCSPRNDPAFKDNNYWRGRIWGPTNFLVYLGLREYDCPEVRQELARKSNALLLKDWLARGYIYENWNSMTGEGDDVPNSDRFYHWGSLLGYISLLENGKI